MVENGDILKVVDGCPILKQKYYTFDRYANFSNDYLFVREFPQMNRADRFTKVDCDPKLLSLLDEGYDTVSFLKPKIK